MNLKTCLYQKHLDAGGKMVEFGGYLMPVQYGSGVIAEHQAVRNAAGLFDVSHMGEVLVSGSGALAYLQQLLTNDMAGLAIGGCRYSPMCNEAGGVVDDLLVYRQGENSYMLVVNASNREKDLEWMQQHSSDEVMVEDLSGEIGEVALQGPAALGILSALTVGGAEVLPQKYYTFKEDVVVGGIRCLVSRTGYTGEDGFELYCASAATPVLWDALLEQGKAAGLIPCGLGARDTLRLEASMPLYGHEMSETITPYEANLGFFVKLDKPDFIGKEALEKAKEPARRRTGLKVTGRGIVREGSPLYLDGREVGLVTSGTMLPHLGWAGAMALVDAGCREEGTQLVAEVRGREIPVEVVKLPFYKRG